MPRPSYDTCQMNMKRYLSVAKKELGEGATYTTKKTTDQSTEPISHVRMSLEGIFRRGCMMEGMNSFVISYSAIVVAISEEHISINR